MRWSVSSAGHHVSAQWLQRHWIFEKNKSRGPRVLRRNRLPRRWWVNAVSPATSGQSGACCPGDCGRDQRVECPPPEAPKCFLSSDILGCPVPLRGTVTGYGMRKPTSHEPWRWGETFSAPLPALREDLICEMALALRVFYALPSGDKGKVQQVHTSACSWGPGFLSKEAFKWVKPFTCWRLNAVRPVVR